MKHNIRSNGLNPTYDDLHGFVGAASTVVIAVTLISQIRTSAIYQITVSGALAIKYRPAPFCFQSRESIISLILQLELIADNLQKGFED
jgi:hypothetical protein